ncbi:uncharacterized protein F5147DRAFT_780618 [Suillus discolor]|uniref:Uncharacterized protein n=1 Tax=Suillus discolor TaxID=1912936 RepID=A0A9P7JMG4_9AGAM|nr:uncharacterized protein F5147DRAFT_780618 [Suillus discolor]KAG2089449.1 hypothetical protein F5147DRAFT_780618 [Suillus discolor]
MPALRHLARRSARLRANTQEVRSNPMDPQASSSQRQPESNRQDTIKFAIQWERDHALTTILINHLTTHPPDCRILFYSDGKKAMPNVDDAPSGKDKNEIHDVIAKLIFATHPKYKTTYHQDLKKFRVSVANRITALKNKYKKCKAKFSATGAGVVPLDATTSNNLLDEVNAELPWYTDLDSMWHSIPSFAIKSHSSRPGVDHAGNLYALVQPHGDPGRAGPSMNFEGAAQPSHSASSPQSQPHLPSHSASSTQLQPHSTFSPQPQPSNGSYNNNPPIDPRLLQAPPSFPRNDTSNTNHDADADMDNGSSNNNPPIDPRLLQAPPSFHRNDTDCNMDGPDDNDNDNDLDLSGALSAPFGDAMRHLEDDPMTPDSHARAAGKKRQLAASPSPPPDVPSAFEVLQKSPTPFYDSRAAFGTQRPSSCGGRHRKTPSIASSGMSRSMSTPSSTTRNTSSDSLISPTPHTSLPTSTEGSKKKKAKSDVQEQVAKVNDEIESIQSSAVSRHEAKHQRFLAKLDAKTDYHRDAKKYEWLRDTRAHESSQAAVNHQRHQESKDAEIRLRETDI